MFVPPAGTANVLNYEVNLIWQTAAVVGTGFAFYAMTRKKVR